MKYIAYGSNMNLAQMAYRCPASKVIGTGKLYGWKLVFKYHADIINTGIETDVVPVVMWEIADEDWKNLDRYEGYPKYYTRKTVNVVMDNGAEEKAVVYVMTDLRSNPELPTQSYFKIILDGCKDNGIDVSYLYDVLRNTYDDICDERMEDYDEEE